VRNLFSFGWVSDLDSIAGFGNAIRERIDRLNVLINNTGMPGMELR
jgi:short-subunit dehydrogenase involved in D-alanine esterification of teichoic acids